MGMANVFCLYPRVEGLLVQCVLLRSCCVPVHAYAPRPQRGRWRSFKTIKNIPIFFDTITPSAMGVICQLSEKSKY